MKGNLIDALDVKSINWAWTMYEDASADTLPDLR